MPQVSRNLPREEESCHIQHQHLCNYCSCMIERMGMIVETEARKSCILYCGIHLQFHISYIRFIRSGHFYIRIYCLQLVQRCLHYTSDITGSVLGLTMCSRTGRTFWQSCTTRVMYSTFSKKVCFTYIHTKSRFIC